MTDATIVLLIMAAMLVLLDVAWSNMPIRWRRWLLRSQQDKVNEATVSTLDAIAQALDTMTLRLDRLDRRLQYLEGTASPEKAARSSSRADISSGEATPRG